MCKNGVLIIAWRPKFKEIYIFRRGKKLRLRKVDKFIIDEINVVIQVMDL
jgi:hypothetical protein